ncbi:hypothetical protein DNTS_004434 [Danionella cerebrum]|uniref:Uncharacterized protein n=1 Tax=Danionella cerebrum TaxID=2873325 RepID=A0A553R7A1_9TELE|nr:hypothetical protein DNTS_004434 [Danionella translucida]
MFLTDASSDSSLSRYHCICVCAGVTWANAVLLCFSEDEQKPLWMDLTREDSGGVRRWLLQTEDFFRTELNLLSNDRDTQTPSALLLLQIKV